MEYYRTCVNHSLTAFNIFHKEELTTFLEMKKLLKEADYKIFSLLDLWLGLYQYNDKEWNLELLERDFPNLLNKGLKRLKESPYNLVILTKEHAISKVETKIFDLEEKGWDNRRIMGAFIIMKESEYKTFESKYGIGN